MSWADSSPGMQAGKTPVNGHDAEEESAQYPLPREKRKKVVVVGLGMVGIAFIEKLIKMDAKRREYDVVVIGEEPHLAYNRVGLTSFFQHRKVENLYLNQKEWYAGMPEGALNYHLNTRVTELHPTNRVVSTSTGDTVPYDILVLATGSDALLPRHTPGHDAKGVFVYRTVDDLEKLIAFSESCPGSTGAVVGGGLLGLEAAKAMMDLESFGQVKLIERNRWVLSRQLDGDAGGMVVDLVRQLGLDVLLSKRVGKVEVDDGNAVKGVVFEDGERMDCRCLMFAIGIKARDELARRAGLTCADRGGGIVVDPSLMTSEKDIYAIGECASWENQTFGLIAPGIEMAEVLAFNMTQAKVHATRKFKRPDLSTKLKLLGVEVASFGDFFADRDGPQQLPGRKHATKKQDGIAEERSKVRNITNGPPPPPVKALTYKDPFQAVYKKYLFTLDGKYLLGGMMIGDTRDYVKLVPMVKNQKALDVSPSEFILGAKKDGEDDGGDLSSDTQICSCHNVTKGDVANVIRDGSCKSIGEVKSCTKAGTGCGGCMPLVQSIFNAEMKAMGTEVLNHLCPHFAYSRADLFNIIYVKKLKNFSEVMKECGKEPESLGCEVCKPTLGSILASLYNQHIMDKPLHGLQDTNDQFLANIQRNGTFSVIPRVAGGEITAEKLIIIGTVAKKYGLYCKITGGQRIDMFGAKKQDLIAIWTELVKGGMESGHAYAKSLRTVKSCVGTTWCRFGIGDSVGMAVRLEERYKSIRSPHKMKGGVSGCVRECAEAQNKDFGLIATEKGFNVFVGGNGGSNPRHSELLAKDVPPDDVVPVLDRYLMFYIRTADKLQRTARWVEQLPGGIKYLREVILEDKLGICPELEKQMDELVGTFFCEWTETINNPERRKAFQQFGNTSEAQETVEEVKERGQSRPAYWPQGSTTEDFRGTKWSSLSWQPMIEVDKFVDAPTGSSANVKRGDTQLAIFKVKGKWYATQQMCPHKRTFAMSEGLIGDDVTNNKLWVSCPFHKRNFALGGEDAGKCSNDPEVNLATFPVEAREDGWVYLKLPPVDELDARLGTSKWKVKQGEREEPFTKLDEKLKGMKGRKPLQDSHLNGGLGERAMAKAITAGGEGGIDCAPAFTKMSVVGVDFGTQNTVIAVARNRGVDVVRIQSLVGFGPKSRYLGEPAKTQEISNIKNTVGSLKRLAGRSLNDPDVQIEKEFVSAPLVDIKGQVGAEVSYMGSKEQFTATQLVSMFFNKVKTTASAELKLPVSDIVISVPPWFTDVQRRSIIDAAEIAGLKLLRLINDTTATALGYGITKLDLPTAEEKPRRVAFVDIGHSNYACSIVEFKKGELAVKSTAYDRHFGGRDFDKALVDHFAKEFKEKYKIDINSNPKARVRVATAAEKMKKILSANSQAPLSIESLMNDVDVASVMKRDELEALLRPLLDRATVPLEQALAEAKLKPDDIDSIEMVGGCTRIPALKERISKYFGKSLSFTLNQDEAVARGCAFSCAILSPVFRVRDFSVHDIVNYPIEFSWEQSPDIPDEDTSLTVFNKGNVMPSTKILTFYRKQPFDLEARYAKPEMLPGKTNPWIGRFSVKGVKADSQDDFMICKLKARLNLHGVLNIESGYYVEDVEIEEPLPEEKDSKESKEGEKKDGDGPAAASTPHKLKGVFKDAYADAKRTFLGSRSLTSQPPQAMDTSEDKANRTAEPKPKTRKIKKQVRKGELPLSAGTASLDQASKEAAAEKENQMFMEDKLVADTEDKKNELESYIYELRGKIDEQYAEFASDQEKTDLKAKLEQAEDWLYEDGEDATKNVYIAKMEEIRSVAGPIVQRYQDKIEEERQAVLRAEEEKMAKKRAELEAKKKAEEEAKKEKEAPKKEVDAEMKDVDAAEGGEVKPDGVEEPTEEGKK
ncbi:MAG: hypothetical protein Q9197_003848 [Variospora fuerteventurae]